MAEQRDLREHLGEILAGVGLRLQVTPALSNVGILVTLIGFGLAP